VIAGPISIASSKQNVIANNYIGTDASGTVALAQPGGVFTSSGSPFFATLNSITGNLISGNTGDGVGLGGNGNSASGNLIGTDATGTLPLGNGGSGVYVTTQSGMFGINSVSNNTIAFNASDGVDSFGIWGGSIGGNSIHDNGGLGINSDEYAPVAPTITSAVTIGSSTIIQGGTTTGQGGTLFVGVFSSPACDPSGFGEGAVALGSTSVPAGSSFVLVVPAAAPGDVVTATATLYETSEFSACAVVSDGGPGPTIQSITPGSGTSTGGTTFTLTGSGFSPGATVTIAGAAATGNVVSETEIQATSPALTPGSLNDVTVTNPTLAAATLLHGWFADFLDVAQDDAFHSYIEQIFRVSITAGCGGGLYCRDGAVRRDQMAVFLLKGEHGASFVPPLCTGIFTDVPCPGTFANWIEQLATENITGGCGGNNYCPSTNNNRGQMAVFVVKTFNLQ